MGLTVNGQHGDTVYLRTFDDYEHHSLVLHRRNSPDSAGSPCAPPARRRSGAGWRRSRRPAARESGPRTEPGRRLYVTTDPDGHEHALTGESERYQAPEELRPALKNQPQAKPNRGVGVRRLDHINFLAADVLANAEWQEQLLGARPTEQIGSTPAGSRHAG
ncbi:Catechol 2,3-dioxygenase OS=Streptomyces fumanus OX=67302 GN=GCM10018772_25220 PE=4 SV=1 [Streptomyces fumanus]